MTLYSGKHITYGIAEETVFGTPVADAAACIQLSCEPFVINPDVKHRAPNRAFGFLHSDKSNVWNDAKGSIPSCSIKSVALKQELALWLYLLFQNVVETGTTPYSKLFTFPTSGPAFESNAGKFITLFGKSPFASGSEKITSMICNNLSLSLSAGADDGNLAFTAGMIGKAFSRTSTPSGTWTKTTDARFNFHDFNVCTLDGSAIILESFKLDLITTMLAKGASGTGSFQTFVMAGQEATATLSGLWDASTRAGLTALDSGAEVTFILSWGTVATDGYLNITMHGIITAGAPEEGDARLVNLTIKGIRDVSAAPDDEPVAITLVDTKHWTWGD